MQTLIENNKTDYDINNAFSKCPHKRQPTPRNQIVSAYITGKETESGTCPKRLQITKNLKHMRELSRRGRRRAEGVHHLAPHDCVCLTWLEPSLLPVPSLTRSGQPALRHPRPNHRWPTLKSWRFFFPLKTRFRCTTAMLNAVTPVTRQTSASLCNTVIKTCPPNERWGKAQRIARRAA